MLTRHRYGVLATCSEAGPHPTLVAFAVSADLGTLLFATPRATRKFAHLHRFSQSALLVDDRQNNAAATHEAQAVTAYGRAEEVAGADRDALLSLYLRRHPGLRAFAVAPSCALMQIRVERYGLVSHFQNVIELRMMP